ncbi:MAG: aminoglycoside 6-adenylyltransferase [Eubacteriales bacterium]|nr:aminoglycoside 6-adenylyltransferase [Eubacteriales bacterium]
MRSEQEIMDLILEIAQKDDKIKAVYMNGSRTNPNVPKDIFQDYDIVYVVTDTKPYIEDKGWPDRFGEVWFMQYPDEDYYVAKPNQEQFKSTCNEFWWCLNNVGKGLWRNELPYANDMLNFVIRKMLERMLCWQVGVTTDFTVSTGKSAKYMYKWIPDNDYNHYLRTYSCGSVEECWNSVFLMTDLFGKYARIVSEAMGFVYNEGEEVACLTYLKLVQKLPKDANEVC